MPFSTPSYSQLQQSAISDILASGVAPNGLLPISILRILAKVIAKNAYLHNEFLRWISLQSVPFSCTENYLDAWASLKGITRYPATSASGFVQFTGTSGATVPLGTTVLRTGDNTQYITTASGTISGTTAIVAVTATTTGASTNGDAGLAVTLSGSLNGISSSGVFSTAATGGNDMETDQSLRTRMLAAFAAVGSAGSTSNFQQFALSADGVTRTWISPWGVGYGSVVVYCCKDGTNASNNGFLIGSNGVASGETRWTSQVATGDQLLIANTIFPLQPITGLVFVASPVPYHVTISITNLSISISSSITAAVLAAVQAYLYAIGTPLGCTIYQSGLETAIQSAVGSQATFTLATPASNLTLPVGYLPLTIGSDLSIT